MLFCKVINTRVSVGVIGSELFFKVEMEFWWEERAIENVKVGSQMENVKHEVVGAKKYRGKERAWTGTKRMKIDVCPF